jgi:tetratricopeptide (TPR) repeat protein
VTDPAERSVTDPGQAADPVRQFWELWQHDTRPDWHLFLARCAPLSAAQMAAVLCVDLRERWRRDERPAAEDYLRDCPKVRADREVALDVAYCEFLVRDARGEAPAPDEYAARFPDLAPDLARQIEVHRALGKCGSTAVTMREPADEPARHPAHLDGAARVPGCEMLGRLGQGGMGVVYKAWQVRLHRVVAVKMLRPGAADSPAALARFRVEGEAVARLQHPNIVQMHDVGDLDGRPYFVMEYAEGGSLADKLDGTPWPGADAARLVETLARAVEHAHERGVLHRDLTPGNVLLAADGTPKLSDFGLAKLLVGGDTLTEAGAIFGTPSYMSPEQAEGSAAGAGPAADVYALGAILYELLTGRPPFKAATPLETLAQVKSVEPVPPRRLQPQTARDLETICLKCLRKEPGRRYATAAALAEDLRRFRAGEPISARPVGPAERAWRWARRKPVVAGLVAALVVAVAAGVGLVSWNWREAVAARRRAEIQEAEAREQRQVAEERLVQACNVIDAMLVHLAADELAGVPGAERVRRNLLTRAIQTYEWLRQQDDATPFLRERSAYAYRRTAEMLRHLGRTEEALPAAEHALTLQTRVAAEEPDRPEYRADLAACHNILASLLHDVGKAEQADAESEEALAIEADLAARYPDVARYQWELSMARHNHAIRLRLRKDVNGAVEEQQRALELRGKLIAAHPQDTRYRFGQAQAHYSLGNLMVDLRRGDDAITHFTEALEVLSALLADDPENAEYLSLQGQAHHNRGLRRSGEQRREDFERALEGRLRLVEDFPRVAAYRRALAGDYASLGSHVTDTDLARSQECYAASAQHLRRLVAAAPGNAEDQSQLGASLNNLALRLQGGPRWRECRALYEEAVVHQKEALKAAPGNGTYQTFLRKHYGNLCGILPRMGLHAEAAAVADDLARASADTPEGLWRAGVTYAWCMMLAGRDAGLGAGREAAVARYAVRANDLYDQAIQKGVNDLGAWCALALLEAERGKPDGYRRACGEAVRRFARPSDPPRSVLWAARACGVAPGAGADYGGLLKLLEERPQAQGKEYDAWCVSAALLYRAGRYEEALKHLDEAARVHGHGGAAWDQFLRALALGRLNQPDKAQECLARGRDWQRRADGGQLQDPVFPNGPDQWHWLELRLLERQADEALSPRK